MSLKQSIYKLSKGLGLFHVSSWITRRRLQILCYHGFSLHDEHRFRPKLFIDPQLFASRIRYLKNRGVPVLPLSRAIELSDQGRLPDHPVVLTIDDGFYSVFREVLPVLKQAGFPAMVYVTTYYVDHQNPIFRLVVQYMFWKTQCTTLDTSAPFTPNVGTLNLQDENSRESWIWKFVEHAETHCQEPDRKALAEELGKRLGVDYEEFVNSRALSLMTPGEIQGLLADGIDIGLHTHRHRFPTERESALRELRDNSAALERITGQRLHHFCYPSGLWSTEHWPWLKESQVRTATTCDPGLNTPATPRFGLQRFLDGENISQIEFEAEICGFAEILRALFRKRRNAYVSTVEN